MYKRSLDFKYWDARFYQDKNGDIRNKIRRGNGKRQQKGAIATVTGDRQGYLRICDWINGRKVWIKAHRLAWLLHTGKCPGDLEINHRNQDKTDNRIQNLEVLPHSDHMRKHPKLKTCTSGVTGVHWHKVHGKWQVEIGINGKPTYIGIFEDFDEAVKCRKAAEKEHGYFPEHGITREEVQKLYEEEVEQEK